MDLCCGLDSLGRALLLYARRAVADLARTGSWEAEYPRDVWRMHRLGFDGSRTLQFDRITQPWLRGLAKRWVRLRLSSGLGLEAGGARAVADLGHERHPQRRIPHIALLNGFFVAIRQHRWHPGLPATAPFFPADHPRRPDKLPRALAEQVMTQLEQSAILDRFDNPSYRLITVILMHGGLLSPTRCGYAATASPPTPTAPPICATSTTRCTATPAGDPDVFDE